MLISPSPIYNRCRPKSTPQGCTGPRRGTLPLTPHGDTSLSLRKGCCRVALSLATHLGCTALRRALPKSVPIPRPSHSRLSLQSQRGWASCACETPEAKIKVATSMNNWNDEIAFVTLVFCYLTSVYVCVAGQPSSSLSIQDTRFFFSFHHSLSPLMKLQTWAYLTEPVMACESIRHPWVKSVET